MPLSHPIKGKIQRIDRQTDGQTDFSRKKLFCIDSKVDVKLNKYVFIVNAKILIKYEM